MRSWSIAALTALLACHSSGSGSEDDGGSPIDQGRACSVEAPGDTYAENPEAFVEACVCYHERLFTNGPERGCQLVSIIAAGSITGMPDPEAIWEQSCELGVEYCLANPMWLTAEGRAEICERLFDSAAPCETLAERQECHEQLVDFEATHHERLACEWPQPVPLPCGLAYGC